MRYCLFAVLNSFNQLFFGGEYFPWRAYIFMIQETGPTKEGELCNSLPSVARVKGLWENHLSTNNYLHGKQITKMFCSFQKPSRNLTFACNHAWEKKKSSWLGRVFFHVIFRSLKYLWHNQSWPFTSKIKGLRIWTGCT